jgi:hypothetical protein
VVLIDAEAIFDVDYPAQTLLKSTTSSTKSRQRLLFARVTDAVRAGLDRYGITDLARRRLLRTPRDVVSAPHSTTRGPRKRV